MGLQDLLTCVLLGYSEYSHLSSVASHPLMRAAAPNWPLTSTSTRRAAWMPTCWQPGTWLVHFLLMRSCSDRYPARENRRIRQHFEAQKRVLKETRAHKSNAFESSTYRYVILQQWSILRLKMAVFWVVTPYSMAEAHRHDDGGRKHLWNDGKLLLDYMAQQPGWKPSLYSPPWEPEISLRFLGYLTTL
jgi:hypothetical protein